MGLFTILCGFICGLLLPDSFKNPWSTFLSHVSLVSERELHILQTRVVMDDPMKGMKKKHSAELGSSRLLGDLRVETQVIPDDFIGLKALRPQLLSTHTRLQEDEKLSAFYAENCSQGSLYRRKIARSGSQCDGPNPSGTMIL
ncbi:hypothetical protein JHW43_003579 [Diplocarpon mali]|nr:hypothetical protein JHW43_003579 [Diplocarpon mali]